MPAANQDQKLKAAELVAKGRFTNVQIAKVAQISLRTLSAWKALPEFQQQVREVKDAWRGKARGTGLADQDFRLRNENDRYNRLRAIINARAQDPPDGVAAGAAARFVPARFQLYPRAPTA